MRQCTEYETELSAVLDGESDPATVIDLLDHVAECPSCRAFFQQLRSFQTALDEGVTRRVEARTEAVRPRHRWFDLGWAPRWVWAPVAVFVLALGLSAAGVFDLPFVGGPTGPGNETVIRLNNSNSGGDMDEARFVRLVGEVLRADRRYRDEMYVVLSQLQNDIVPGETPMYDLRDEPDDSETEETQIADNTRLYD